MWHTLGLLLHRFIYADLRVKDLGKMQTPRVRARPVVPTVLPTTMGSGVPRLIHTSSGATSIRGVWPGSQTHEPAEARRKLFISEVMERAGPSYYVS